MPELKWLMDSNWNIAHLRHQWVGGCLETWMHVGFLNISEPTNASTVQRKLGGFINFGDHPVNHQKEKDIDNPIFLHKESVVKI